MKKKFLIVACFLIVLLFAACRYSADNVHGRNVSQNATSECLGFDIDNTVDYVIAGDAKLAAHGFLFPLRHPGFQPLMQIKNSSDFIRLFPVMFDKGVREELKRMKETEGWGFRNWRGEMFGNGAFWRDNPEWGGADKRIHTVLITGEEFDKYYQKVYAKDKMNLTTPIPEAPPFLFLHPLQFFTNALVEHDREQPNEVGFVLNLHEGLKPSMIKWEFKSTRGRVCVTRDHIVDGVVDMSTCSKRQHNYANRSN